MISRPADVRRLLSEATHVLFDFDGPICDVYAGLPAPTVASWSAKVMRCQDKLQAILQASHTLLKQHIVISDAMSVMQELRTSV